MTQENWQHFSTMDEVVCNDPQSTRLNCTQDLFTHTLGLLHADSINSLILHCRRVREVVGLSLHHADHLCGVGPEVLNAGLVLAEPGVGEVAEPFPEPDYGAEEPDVQRVQL